jgi:hypothetical protein
MQKINFRNWPGWFKGGVIYVLILLVFMLIDNVLLHNNLCQEGSPFAETCAALWGFYLILFLPLTFLDEYLLSINDQYWVIIQVAFTFIIGALLGWINGKMKSNR